MREFYEISIRDDVLEFFNWILNTDPSKETTKTKLKQLANKIASEIQSAIKKISQIKDSDLER